MKLFRAELKRLLCRRGLWILLACAVVLPILLSPGSTGWTQENHNWKATGMIWLSVVMASSTCLVLGGTYWGADFRHGTIATLLTFVPDRKRIWMARMSALALVTSGFFAVCLAVGFHAFFVITGGQLGRLDDSDLVVPYLVRGLILCIMAVLVGACLAIIFKSTVAAAIVPFAYVIVRGIFSLFIPMKDLFGGKLAFFLPDVYVMCFSLGGGRVAYSLSDDHSRYGEVYISSALAFAVLLGIVFALGALSLILFSRRSVTE